MPKSIRLIERKDPQRSITSFKAMIPSPEFFITPEDTKFLQEFQERIKDRVQKPDTFLNYPIVYIHYWPSQTVSYIEKRQGKKSLSPNTMYMLVKVTILLKELISIMTQGKRPIRNKKHGNTALST